MQFWPTFWRSLYLGCSITAVSVAGSAAKENTQVNERKYVTVTDKENDSKVSLSKGAILIVRLEAPRGEGYQWQIVKNKTELLKSIKAPIDKLGKAPPSKVEVQAFYLQAEAPGTVELMLEYKKAADKNAKAEKSYKVTVQIE